MDLKVMSVFSVGYKYEKVDGVEPVYESGGQLVSRITGGYINTGLFNSNNYRVVPHLPNTVYANSLTDAIIKVEKYLKSISEPNAKVSHIGLMNNQAGTVLY